MKIIKFNKDKEAIGSQYHFHTLLHIFLTHAGESLKSFTYFDKRDASVLDNHVATYIGMINEAPAAYGHLDEEEDKVWLGIVVADDYRRQGLGNKMMDQLVRGGKENNLEIISLSVYKSNPVAYKLYEKYGFKRVKESEESYFYELNLSK